MTRSIRFLVLAACLIATSGALAAEPSSLEPSSLEPSSLEPALEPTSDTAYVPSPAVDSADAAAAPATETVRDPANGDCDQDAAALPWQAAEPSFDRVALPNDGGADSVQPTLCGCIQGRQCTQHSQCGIACYAGFCAYPPGQTSGTCECGF